MKSPYVRGKQSSPGYERLFGRGWGSVQELCFSVLPYASLLLTGSHVPAGLQPADLFVVLRSFRTLTLVRDVYQFITGRCWLTWPLDASAFDVHAVGMQHLF